MTDAKVALHAGEELRRYGFGDGHPFGPDRFDAFWSRVLELGLDGRTVPRAPRIAADSELLAFHTRGYIRKIKHHSATGDGFLDAGDTPAFQGIYEAAATVVGTTLDACRGVMSGDPKRAFIPIAGLHHGRRDQAGGFCALNDCGVAIEILHREYGLERIAYVDIDAHHGDGVYYEFEETPWLWFVDLHEDGRYLYPGTGAPDEVGKGDARGRKLNLPMRPGATDEDFLRIWPVVESFLDSAKPEFILFQCGADSLAGDPITHLRYSAAAHAHAAARLCAIADRHAQGRIVAMGGGGYNRRNLALAWCAVVQAMLEQ